MKIFSVFILYFSRLSSAAVKVEPQTRSATAEIISHQTQLYPSSSFDIFLNIVDVVIAK